MERSEKKAHIERFIRAYNRFDLEGMTGLMHRECAFENFSAGRVSASAQGIEEFQALAERSAALFSARCQRITGYRDEGDAVTVDIEYEGVLRVDVPGRYKAGETVRLKGHSLYTFREGLISRIRDCS